MTSQSKVISINRGPEKVNIGNLPFVGDVNGKRSFWRVNPVGEYADDYFVGRAYALEFLNYIARTGTTFEHVWILKAMPKEYGGIESGFINTITSYAISGAVNNASFNLDVEAA